MKLLSAKARLGGPPMKILLVDDMPVFREPLAATLRLAGFMTLTAPDGEWALERVRADKPDLVLLDVAMPKLDGIGFLTALRAEPKPLCETKVILLTAVSEKPFLVAASALGVDEYLLKSRFRSAELIQRIQRLLAAPTEQSQAA